VVVLRAIGNLLIKLEEFRSLMLTLNVSKYLVIASVRSDQSVALCLKMFGHTSVMNSYFKFISHYLS